MSQPSKNLYKILEVSRKATKKDIKLSYMRLAKTMHPDRVNEPEEKAKAEEAFKAISHAYSVLSDSAKRKRYDLETSYVGYRYTGRSMREMAEGEARYAAYAKQAESMEEAIQSIFEERQKKVEQKQRHLLKWILGMMGALMLIQWVISDKASKAQVEESTHMDTMSNSYVPAYKIPPKERL